MKNQAGLKTASAATASRAVRRTLLSSAVLAALSTMTAQAQNAAPAAAPAATAEVPAAPASPVAPASPATAVAPAGAASAPAAARNQVEKLETVVVTGTAGSSGLKKLDASFSITTANEEQIKDAAPSSAADLLKIVPGVSVETTGGQTGNNIEVRGFAATGDAPWTSFQLNGATIFPMPTLSFFEGSTLFRLDDTIERVEVLRGGPSPLFADGNPGATVNFIMKKGGNEPEGGLRVTAGTGDLKRIDGFYTGKISDGWYGSFGGFYRTSQGIRDTGFPSDRGGQFSAMLTRKLEDGELSMYGRWLNDKNTFFLPIPLLTSNGGHTLNSFPGFPAQTATFIGNELRQVEFESTPGNPPGKTKVDMADGRGVEMHLYGVNLDKKLGDWTISNKANYMAGTVPTYAWFTGANPSTVDEFIAANLNGSTGGSASYVNNGGGAVAGSQQVMSIGAWTVVKKLQSFTNDFRISRDLTKDNTLTAGVYLSDYSSDDVWSLGNNFLVTLEPHGGRLVDVTLSGNPAGDKVLTRKGQLSGAFFNLNAHYNGQNTAVFLADEWRVNKDLRLDGGLRYERQRVNGTVSNASGVDLDANPNTLYNNGVSVVNGSVNTISQTDHHSAWTAGANYYLAPEVSVFGRINSGFQFPQFDNLRGGLTQTTKVKQYEIGLKTNTKLYSLFLTGFYNDFSGLSFTQITTTGTLVNTAGSKSKGIEAEAVLRPLPGLDLAVTGDWLDAKYTNFNVGPGDDRTGNRVIRQPKLQVRFTPSYRFTNDMGTFKVFATYSHIGDRFNDTQNLQILPKFNTLDAGLVAHLNSGIDVRLTGRNLTNAIGITEGNTRVTTSGITNGVFLGRPIFGRSAEVSVGFNF